MLGQIGHHGLNVPSLVETAKSQGTENVMLLPHLMVVHFALEMAQRLFIARLLNAVSQNFYFIE